MKICIIEGPLLDRVGDREPDIYGGFSREELVNAAKEKGDFLGIEVVFLSSYHEGELASIIAECSCDGMILNPGAYTHTSILIRDAALCSRIPFVEAHISNIFKREEFRKRSFLSDVANGFICGLGVFTYASALEAIYSILKIQREMILKLDKKHPRH